MLMAMPNHSRPHATPAYPDLATPPPEFIRVGEAVRLFGFSRASLYREHGMGRITFRKYGRTTLVDVASLRALIESLPIGVTRP